MKTATIMNSSQSNLYVNFPPDNNPFNLNLQYWERLNDTFFFFYLIHKPKLTAGLIQSHKSPGFYTHSTDPKIKLP